MVARRGFLGGMIAAITSPSIAKADAAQTALFKGSGISEGVTPYIANVAGREYPGRSDGKRPWYVTRRLKLESLRIWDPDFLRKKAERENRDVDCIEPSVMALKSVSPLAKIAIQRDRNIKRAMDFESEIEGYAWQERVAMMFKDEDQ